MSDELTVKLAPLSLRADLGPRSIDEADRSVELIFTTGAAVRRKDYWTGKEYLEVLSLDPAHVRLERLNDGAPLLDSHSAYSVADQLGAVIPGSVALHRKAITGRVKFSRREAVDGVWQDVQDGLIRNVSIGYRIHKFEEKAGKGDAIPTRTAVDWEPFEVSMVPIPADAAAKVRSGDADDANECLIVRQDDQPADPPTAEDEPQTQTAAAAAASEEEDPMSETKPTTVRAVDPLAAPAPKPAPKPAEPNDRDRGIAQERARVQGILQACRAARLPQSFADQLIADDVPLVDAQSRVFAELSTRDVDIPTGCGRVEDISVGDDPLIHVRQGITDSLLHRMFPKTAAQPGGYELTEVGREYRGMSLLRVAEAYLQHRGIRTTGMSRMELAGRALGLNTRDVGGLHSTSDFANLLADVGSKTLRAAYDAAPQTFLAISRRVTLPDFKPVRRLQIGEAPQLLAVDEHGEFTRGTIGEGKEQFQLATYGRVFGLTRKAIVNDDLDAFGRVATLFGRAARNLESNLVWYQITSNPTMGDGNSLFDATNHANLDATGADISVESIGAGRAAMRVQTGLDGETILNISPRYLIVPAALETLADQFVSVNVAPAQAGNVNPFAGRLTVIAEPRLDGSSEAYWYLAASTDQVDILEHGYLEGEEGPAIESRVGFDVDGLEIKARLDFAAKAIDWRGLYRNNGTT